MIGSQFLKGITQFQRGQQPYAVHAEWLFLLWTILFIPQCFLWLYPVPDLKIWSCQLTSSPHRACTVAMFQFSRRWVWRQFCVQGDIYSFVSCWHSRNRLEMAKGALVDDECLFRMMIQGTELQYSLPAVGPIYTRTFPQTRNSWFCSSPGSQRWWALSLDLLFISESSICPQLYLWYASSPFFPDLSEDVGDYRSWCVCSSSALPPWLRVNWSAPWPSC